MDRIWCVTALLILSNFGLILPSPKLPIPFPASFFPTDLCRVCSVPLLLICTLFNALWQICNSPPWQSECSASLGAGKTLPQPFKPYTTPIFSCKLIPHHLTLIQLLEQQQENRRFVSPSPPATFPISAKTVYYDAKADAKVLETVDFQGYQQKKCSSQQFIFMLPLGNKKKGKWAEEYLEGDEVCGWMGESQGKRS